VPSKTDILMDGHVKRKDSGRDPAKAQHLQVEGSKMVDQRKYEEVLERDDCKGLTHKIANSANSTAITRSAPAYGREGPAVRRNFVHILKLSDDARFYPFDQ